MCIGTHTHRCCRKVTTTRAFTSIHTTTHPQPHTQTLILKYTHTQTYMNIFHTHTLECCRTRSSTHDRDDTIVTSTRVRMCLSVCMCVLKWSLCCWFYTAAGQLELRSTIYIYIFIYVDDRVRSTRSQLDLHLNTRDALQYPQRRPHTHMNMINTPTSAATEHGRHGLDFNIRVIVGPRELDRDQMHIVTQIRVLSHRCHDSFRYVLRLIRMCHRPHLTVI